MGSGDQARKYPRRVIEPVTSRKKTLFAVGDNDARYILNGLLITLHSADKKVTMKLVGTEKKDVSGPGLALFGHGSP